MCTMSQRTKKIQDGKMQDSASAAFPHRTQGELGVCTRSYQLFGDEPCLQIRSLLTQEREHKRPAWTQEEGCPMAGVGSQEDGWSSVWGQKKGQCRVWPDKGMAGAQDSTRVTTVAQPEKSRSSSPPCLSPLKTKVDSVQV